MVTFRFGEDSKIEVPENWGEIKLGDYDKWFRNQPKNRQEMVQHIANVCKVDVDVLMSQPSEVFESIFNIVQFVFEENVDAVANAITIEGVNYALVDGADMTLGEWVDIESVFEKDSDTRLVEILSILCRPVGEKYDTKVADTRQTLFAMQPMDKVMPLLTFFLQRKERFEAISNLYSQVELQVAQCQELIQDFVANGDGIKLLPISQRIKFWFLTKFLTKKLSKYSDFFSTNTTKFMPKKSKKSFLSKCIDKIINR